MSKLINMSYEQLMLANQIGVHPECNQRIKLIMVNQNTGELVYRVSYGAQDFDVTITPVKHWDNQKTDSRESSETQDIESEILKKLTQGK